MKIELIKNDDDKVVGWKMLPENEEDYTTIAHIRDLSYWETIKYHGRVMKEKGNDVKENIKHLSWVTEEFQQEIKKRLFRSER